MAICKSCGGDFEQVYSRQRYCSQSCAAKALCAKISSPTQAIQDGPPDEDLDIDESGVVKIRAHKIALSKGE